MKKALFSQDGDNQRTHCHLCAHGCLIREGKTGLCGVRKNIGGVLYSLSYGKIISEHIDPVEKKPFFHFCPGSQTYSIATVGCTFQCLNCQNYEISQYPREHESGIVGGKATAEEIVQRAVRAGCASVAYTYTEPTVFYEFAYDTARLAREHGLYNLYVTNGFMTADAVAHVADVLDGANIDLKSFSDGFYRKVCKARLPPVLNTIRLMKTLGVWVEITTLIIPGMNDSEGELKKIASFIKEADPDIPWHVSAFRPTYKLMDIPPTPAATLERARDIGLDCGLRYVYTGNVAAANGKDTGCYKCGRLVVERSRYSVLKNRLKDGRCPVCGAGIAGVWAHHQQLEGVTC